MKVLDVSFKAVSHELQMILLDQHCTYLDTKDLNEHLVNIFNAVESFEEDLQEHYVLWATRKESLRAELTELNKLCEEHDCSYVRFIKI